MIDSGFQGGLGGLLGWHGSNHKFELTNMIKNTNKTIGREARRANRKHAAKSVAKLRAYCNNKLSAKLWGDNLKSSTYSTVVTFAELVFAED